MRKVLVVDDSSTMRRILTRSLVSCGVDSDQIVTACNGSEALDVFRDEPPGLALCDVAMPVLDGIGLLERLNAENLLTHTNMLFVTSLATDELRASLESQGAVGVIAKPFSPPQLHALIEPHLAALAEPLVPANTNVEPAPEPAPAPPLHDENWLAQTLDQVVAAALAEMAYADAVRCDEAPPNGWLMFVGSVNMGPNARGVLRVAATAPVATLLAETLLGGDAELDDRDRCDAMQEIANIIGGAILQVRATHQASPWSLGVANGAVASPGHHGLSRPCAYQLDDEPGALFVDVVGVPSTLEEPA